MESGNEVVCAGILVADHFCTPMSTLPEEGHLVAVDAMYLLTGGCAANVAVNVAKQGIRVGVVGKVGEDYWGRFVREDLDARGVDTRQLMVSRREQTSQTMILLCKGQDRRFVHTFGANRDFRAEDISRDQLRGAKVLYLGGYLVLPSLIPAELASLFRYCREQEIRTVLDVVIPTGFAYDGELDGVLPDTDVFLPNNDEAEMLTGEVDPVRQADLLLGKGAETVVVTLGGEGLLCARGGEMWHASHFPSDVVDQTGAGDAFCAGFITGMVRGEDLEGCVRYGSALGASCVRSIGCYEGVFNASQSAEFLAANRLEMTRLR
jgi:sugar/nucleoside kinase (ribokinase family)